MMHIHTTHQCKVARKAEARRVSPTPDDVKDIYLGFYSHDVRVDMYRVATLLTNETGYEQMRCEVGAGVTVHFRCSFHLPSFVNAPRQRLSASLPP